VLALGAVMAMAACSCQSIRTRSAEADRADSLEFAGHWAATPPSEQMAQVETTLVNFSNALAAGDRDSLVALTDEGFTRIEDGHTYDREQMIASVQQTLESGSMFLTPVDFDVKLEGPVAHCDYHVVGEFKSYGKRTLLSRVETAVLQRREGYWRVMQMTTMAEVER
jgi:hypothetical protein